MSKFKVDLNANDRPERFSDEGDYIVIIQGVERAMTPQGVEKSVLTLTDDKNRQIKDDLLNKETVHWRLNQLIVATGMKIAHGTEFDFSRSGEFFNFVKSFVGMKLKITLKKETYEKDGEHKTKLKIARFSSAQDAPF